MPHKADSLSNQFPLVAPVVSYRRDKRGGC